MKLVDLIFTRSATSSKENKIRGKDREKGDGEVERGVATNILSYRICIPNIRYNFTFGMRVRIPIGCTYFFFFLLSIFSSLSIFLFFYSLFLFIFSFFLFFFCFFCFLFAFFVSSTIPPPRAFIRARNIIA